MNLVNRLKNILPEGHVIVNSYELHRVAKDESGMPPCVPQAIVRPGTEDECIKVVKLCAEAGVALIPRGAGTGLEGAAIPVQDAVVLDLTVMDRVLKRSPEDHFVLVEPGIVYDQLNLALRDTGLFFPPSPGGSSDTATIGGMVATNASGIYAFRYGGTASWVRTLRVITGTGEVLNLGSKAPKSSTGYDLTHLFVGSEGTLGVITAIGLGLAAIPNDRIRTAFSFTDLKSAVAAAVEMAWAVPELAAIELIDRGTMVLIGDFLQENVPHAHSLFLEFHAMDRVSDGSVELANQVALEYGGKVMQVTDPWRLRHYGTRAVTAKHATFARTDAGVPLSALNNYMDWVQNFARQRSVYAFGHVGIGIVHLLMPVDNPSGPQARIFKQKAAEVAVSMGGTVSGEHGIGLGNRAFALQQYGNSLQYMREIKRVFDPNGILNPGKVI